MTNEEKKKLCKEDLKYLCKDVLGYKDWDNFHDELKEFLDGIEYGQRSRQYRLILLPRGHLKSCVVTKGWTIQQILNNPNIRILIGNAIWDNARGFLKTIMQYLDGASILSDLFDNFRPKSRGGLKWTPDGFTVKQRTVPLDAATVTSTGVERTQTSQHYDIIILDDIVSRENISTKEQRDKVKNFYKDCLSLLEPDGIMIVIGTTWHEDDLYSAQPDDSGEGAGLMYDKDFKMFKRVAEKGTQESVLFKNKYTLKDLKLIKQKQGAFLYSAQYLLDPYPDESMCFSKEWFKYWKFPTDNIRADRVIPLDKPMYIAMTLDMSQGKEKSDFAAIVSVGMVRDEMNPDKTYKYILEARRFKCKPENFGDEVIKTYLKLDSWGFRPDLLGLEHFGFQQSLMSPIKDKLREKDIDLHVELITDSAVISNRDSHKEDRIKGLIPNFSAEEIYMHESQNDLKDELMRFNPTTRNKHDDIIDALAWNKIYWGRKPKEVPKQTEKEGSLKWWKERIFQPNTENDVFADMR